MLLNPIVVFLLWIKFILVRCQWYNGYSTSNGYDQYSQLYNYACGQSGYDYSQYGQSEYPIAYSQPAYDYYAQPPPPIPETTQQPIVVVVNGNNDDNDRKWDWFDLISLFAFDNNGGNNGPIYIPYPIPVPCCNCDGCDCNCGSNFGNDCGCQNRGCGCSNCQGDCQYYDSYDGNCGCNNQRSRQKCGCNSGSGCSNSNCGCKNCGGIKHKSDRCHRG